MPLSKQDVQHIAKLSRLHVSEIEIETYRTQLGSILAYVEKLQEVDTTNVPELQHAIEVTNVFRDDEVEICDVDVRLRALENFPNRKDDLLQVQAVFEGRVE